MSLVAKYRQPQISQEGFFDVVKSLFGIKSEAYSIKRSINRSH